MPVIRSALILVSHCNSFKNLVIQYKISTSRYILSTNSKYVCYNIPELNKKMYRSLEGRRVVFDHRYPEVIKFALSQKILQIRTHKNSLSLILNSQTNIKNTQKKKKKVLRSSLSLVITVFQTVDNILLEENKFA